METVRISTALLTKIGAYLVERPYREVAHLIGEMSAAMQPEKPSNMSGEASEG